MKEPTPRRRSSTLSISLTPELADAISERVRSGLYTSASELIREALRLFLRVEQAQRLADHGAGIAADGSAAYGTAARFARTMDLLELGAALGGCERPLPEEARARLEALAERQEAGPGLRISPERLARLTLRE
jgi:antitoxin ParD1/3/4